MKLESFAETMKERVQKRLGDGYQVTVRREKKNNGVKYIGLGFKRDGAGMTSVIYLNDHFKRYEEGVVTFKEIEDYVVRNCRGKSPCVDIRQFLHYEDVRKNIVFRLINTERNKELLEDIPHLEFMDLSIVFRYLFMESGGSTATILIHNVHMKLWDVTVEDLFVEAEENTQRLEGYEIKSMTEVLCEIMGNKNPEEYDHDECMQEFSGGVPMYVLSNTNRTGGAACMLYPDLLGKYADMAGSSFYIIPSSVHELLLVPAGNRGDEESIKRMIKEVNDTQVSEEEILSYSLYYYDRESGKISIC